MKPIFSTSFYSLILPVAFVLASCGGGSGGDTTPDVDGPGIPGAPSGSDTGGGSIPGAPPEPDAEPIPGDGLLIGKFLDSAVVDISYRTETRTGTTDNQGQFNFRTGENITFFIGSLEFPEVRAEAIVTPVEMAQDADNKNATTTNIARLLQSLDVDGDASNGIVISDIAEVSAMQIDFDVSESEFEDNAAVLNLVANSGSVNTALISAEEADLHLQQTLIDIAIPGS